MKYIIHTYTHASGHSKKVRRVMYTQSETKEVIRNFEVLGGKIERAEVDTLTMAESVRARHAIWSDETFGDVGPIGPLKHLAKEAIEAAEAIDDLSEWADIQLLMWDAQRRAGITDEQLINACAAKLAVNKMRTWKKVIDGQPVHHEKNEGGE